MARKLEITMTPKMEQVFEKLRDEIAPDDIYMYTVFFIERMSIFMHDLHDEDPELYTHLCLEDEEHLLFLNLLASYEKLLWS